MNEKKRQVIEAIRSAMKACDSDGYIKEDSTNGDIVRLDGWFALDAVTNAAIEAMHEPTAAMIRAGEACDDFTTQFAQGAEAVEHWRAMIDAALKD